MICGSVDVLGFMHDNAESFLRGGNEFLFGHNIKNSKGLLANGALSGSFTDANGAIISFDGLAGKSLDYAMVQFEQNKVQNFISQYQQDNPNANIDDIIETINGSFSAFGAPSEIKKWNTEMTEKWKPYTSPIIDWWRR